MKLIYILLTVFVVGCGSNTDTNSTVELQDINITNVHPIDNNVTNIVDNNVTNQIDNNVSNYIDNNVTVNVDVNITALSSGYYGDGSFLNPYTMMKANYKIQKGEQWFTTPILNQNCTIRIRTRVYITNIQAESSELLPIDITHVNNNVFQFDVNNSWATLDFVSTDNGYITIVGDCLDAPKLYNLGE